VFSGPPGAFLFWHAERDESFIAGFGSNDSIRSVPHAYIVAMLLVLPLWRAWTWSRKDASSVKLLGYSCGFLALLGWVGTCQLYFCALPLFVLVTLVAVPIVAARPWDPNRERRWRQSTPIGICAVCGYDLRATPHRCPECGTIPPKAAA
jgi:hypothetical protein